MSRVRDFNQAISSLQKRRAWVQAVDTFECLTQQFYPDVVSFNALINALDWPQALLTLSVLNSANVISYSSSISACEKKSAWPLALDILRKMSVKPDVYSWSSCITAGGKEARWQVAMRLMTGMGVERVEANLVTFNALITACERGEEWQEAVQLLERMPERRLHPDGTSLGASISACETYSRWDLAVTYLEVSERRRSAPLDLVSCNSLISACEKAKRWPKALDLLKGKTDVVSHAAAVSSLGPRWRCALELFMDEKQNNILNLIFCNAFISCCEKGSAWAPALMLLPPEPSLVTYTALSSAVARAAMWQHALWLLDEHERSALQPTVITLGGAISACEEKSQWQQALILLLDLRNSISHPERGGVKYNRTW